MQFTKIIVGQVTDVIVSFDFYNGGAENAYRTIATVTYSTAFAFSRIEVRTIWYLYIQCVYSRTSTSVCTVGPLLVCVQ